MPPTKLLDEITGPNVAVNMRVTNAFAAMYQRPDDVADPTNPGGPVISNPQSKENFMREIILNFIVETVEGYEGGVAAKGADDTARVKARNEITPI